MNIGIMRFRVYESRAFSVGGERKMPFLSMSELLQLFIRLSHLVEKVLALFLQLCYIEK